MALAPRRKTTARGITRKTVNSVLMSRVGEAMSRVCRQAENWQHAQKGTGSQKLGGPFQI